MYLSIFNKTNSNELNANLIRFFNLSSFQLFSKLLNISYKFPSFYVPFCLKNINLTKSLA